MATAARQHQLLSARLPGAEGIASAPRELRVVLHTLVMAAHALPRGGCGAWGAGALLIVWELRGARALWRVRVLRVVVHGRPVHSEGVAERGWHALCGGCRGAQ